MSKRQPPTPRDQTSMKNYKQLDISVQTSITVLNEPGFYKARWRTIKLLNGRCLLYCPQLTLHILITTLNIQRMNRSNIQFHIRYRYIG